LTDQERQWFKEASAYSMANIVVNYKREDIEALAFAKEKKNTISEAPADIMKSVQDFREKSLAVVYDLAENKYKIKNSKETIDDFVNTYNKWVELLKDKDTDNVEEMKKVFMVNIFDKL